MLRTFSHRSLIVLRTLQEKVDNVFLEALKLKGLVSMMDGEISFRWVFPDDLFESTSMICDGMSDAKGFKVQMCLRPAMIQKMGDGETVLVKALVTLQHSTDLRWIEKKPIT